MYYKSWNESEIFFKWLYNIDNNEYYTYTYVLELLSSFICITECTDEC